MFSLAPSNVDSLASSSSSLPEHFSATAKNPASLRYCPELLRVLKKHRDAGPFLIPVDPVALGIPQYFDIVKQPMDLSTVEKKLLANQYPALEAMVRDVRLILQNCFSFNPPDHVVYKMGQGFEKFLNNQLKKLPALVCC